MANRRELKRNINYVFEDIIEAAYLHQALHPETDKEKSEAIVDEAIADFDALIAMMNVRDVENKKAHFKKTCRSCYGFFCDRNFHLKMLSERGIFLVKVLLWAFVSLPL